MDGMGWMDRREAKAKVMNGVETGRRKTNGKVRDETADSERMCNK